jgi:hypothetical protein
MTPEELTKLTPEEKCIRIAELCGWKLMPVYENQHRYGWPDGKHIEPPRRIPDYLNDLNAMHEAEHNSTFHVGNYCEALMEITSRGNPGNRTYWNLLHATAAQRADAFLQTLSE